MNLKISIFATLIIVFVFSLSSCESDETNTHSNIISIQDTLTGFSLQDYNIAITEYTAPWSFVSKLFVMYPSKAYNATSAIDVNLVIDLPVVYSTYPSIIANGIISLKAKEGYNLFTIINPSNTAYKGEVLELNSVVRSTRSERGYKTQLVVEDSALIELRNLIGVPLNFYYQTLGNALTSLVADLNSNVDENLGFTLSIVNVAGEEKSITRADEINWLDHKKIILKGRMYCKLALTTKFGQDFEGGDLPLSNIFYGEGCGFDGKYKDYLFKPGTAITLPYPIFDGAF
jgi:hypothetical protein